MAKQLNLLSAGNVIPTALHTEMEQSYLEYAMSVIVGRALPDVRDGLKPVHRRILYAMHELGLTPDRPFRKCARVVGDVLGKYHPHGDQAVYDALVRMVQEFSSRYPLLDGHGNFGSVDDDPPAAMRYTETRLSPLANAVLLRSIGEATVEFTENFDNSQQEPAVLPAELPTLLLNGCSGIAVGMATNIPPHNLGEVVDALIALIDRPTLSELDLMNHIPGPDFPTGGEILGTKGIEEAYLTGRGSIPLRAVTEIEEVQPGKGRHRRTAIVVTELPFQVNKASLLEKIAALINQGKIEGISDLRDESDRDGMRIVIELRRDAQPEVILDQLFRQTPLQSNFGVIMLALVEGQPLQLPLKRVLEEFLQFREATLQREYRHQLAQAQARAHVVEGLLIALDDLDQLIDILRHAPDGGTAKETLQHDLDLSDRQAEAILSMPMRRLTGLERQNLQQEFATLRAEIEQLDTLIQDRPTFLKQLKKDLRDLKKRFGNPRRTKIQGESAQPVIPVEGGQSEPMTVQITQKGYVRTLAANSRSRRKASLTPTLKLTDNQRDLVLFEQLAEPEDQLLVFTSNGKAFNRTVQDLPRSTGRDRGAPLITALPDSVQSEQICTYFLQSDLQDESEYIFLTRRGKIKALPASEFSDMTNRGLTCIKLQPEDALGWVIQMDAPSDLVIATSTARVLRFPQEEVPVLGRTAQGNKALRLLKKENIVGIAPVQPDQTVLLVSRKGYVKRFPLNILRQGHPGDLGTQFIQRQRGDEIVALTIPEQNQYLVVTSEANQWAVLDPDRVKPSGKTDPTSPWVKGTTGQGITQAFAWPKEAL
ncbi:DNA gyrase/topoisomerase IV subunit A [Lyngbya confervoides]|uniref:DNA topoisomerase (ATP-hydrolyzing) n=1 Tax=Lyngbya confervoides BDU141951 TaxID=1574623 RepID=A0ABD4TAN1_9CYAN|nr:DNA topoisomerase (ATP-hydrolyzing) [Lyngbya confervoides]MCM1985235.1 DNA topoisomerase 4 subunit A [Lyngbya confervoides BDU141951]